MKKCKYCGDDGTGLPCSHCMTQSQWESRVAEKIFSGKVEMFCPKCGHGSYLIKGKIEHRCVTDSTGTGKKTRPPEGQRIRCWGRNDKLIGDGIYHNARAVKNHNRAFVSLDDGFWASWNSVKRWASAEPANSKFSGASDAPAATIVQK